MRLLSPFHQVWSYELQPLFLLRTWNIKQLQSSAACWGHLGYCLKSMNTNQLENTLYSTYLQLWILYNSPIYTIVYSFTADTLSNKSRAIKTSNQSTNPDDEITLTPYHFLHIQINGMFASDSVDTTQFFSLECLRYVQELVRHFWHKWIREWFPTLFSRTKWYNATRDVSILF